MINEQGKGDKDQHRRYFPGQFVDMWSQDADEDRSEQIDGIGCIPQPDYPIFQGAFPGSLFLRKRGRCHEQERDRAIYKVIISVQTMEGQEPEQEQQQERYRKIRDFFTGGTGIGVVRIGRYRIRRCCIRRYRIGKCQPAKDIAG